MKEIISELEKALKEVKCTIIGNPDWKKGQKIFEEQLSKDIAAGKLNLDFMKKSAV
jgi:hypothetical protein